MKLSFLGTGLMGAPMVIKLIEAGHEAGVYNRTLEKTKSLESSGVIVFESVSKACGYSNVIISMLSDSDVFDSVIFGSEEIDIKGKTIIQMSTISPGESKKLKEKSDSRGAEYIEAPVLGSIPQIKSKSLITLVGSSKEQFEKWQDLFTAFSNRIEHIGEVGKAAAFKLGLNQLIIGLTTVFSTSLGYVRENDLDIEKFMDIVRNSALYAPTFDKKLSKMLERDFSNPNFPLKHLLKDLNLMINEFAIEGINIAPLIGIKTVIEKGIDDGLGEDDYSSLYNSVHPK